MNNISRALPSNIASSSVQKPHTKKQYTVWWTKIYWSHTAVFSTIYTSADTMLYHLTLSLIISIWSYNELLRILLVTLCVNTDHMWQFSPWRDCWYPGALWHHSISSPDRDWTVTNDHTLTIYWLSTELLLVTLCQHWSYGTVQSLTWLLIPWCLVAPWHQQPWQGLNCHKWSHTDYILTEHWAPPGDTMCQHWSYVTVQSLTWLLIHWCLVAQWHTAHWDPDYIVTEHWAPPGDYVSTLIIWDSSVPDMTADTLVLVALWHQQPWQGLNCHKRSHTDYILTEHWAPPGDTMCQHWSYGTVQSLTWLLIPWCLVAPWHQQPWQGLNCHIL